MENKPHPNRMCSSSPIKNSTSSKEEDSPTPHYHSDKDNPNLDLGINYLSLDNAKKIQINKNEEINEDISNRQEKQDQKALSKPTNMEEIESDGILLTEEQFPWEGYTNWQPPRNEHCNLELYKITEQDYQCSAQDINWLKELIPNKKEYCEKILPNNQVISREKMGKMTKNEYSINPRLKGPTKIIIQAKQHKNKITHHIIKIIFEEKINMSKG
ncbi:hypothetical protein O181_111039 [Austropuccinia psidii MF-1]|uniref:Uncharacterized protein n=1 Tax=Austropuccinia psidii MF-1 TaxID=1389203 RepID=A0A9Q3PRE6_9BASI|nr:hypothetical protein [Austropuccinia psidii MF-1]